MDLHGGTIEARSDGAGQGSEFILRVPLSQRHPAAPRAESAPAAGQRAHRILVVDDNMDAADGLQMLLELGGHEVQAAYDGPSAVALLEQLQADLVFLDLGLPGLDGVEVAQRIRALPRGKDVHIVAVTGWGQEEDKVRTREAGFNGHLTKPVAAEELRSLFCRLNPEESC